MSCYRPGDVVLSLVHRANSLGYGIAGLEPVLCEGIESVDVSAVVRGHSKYRLCVGRVMQLVDLGEAAATLAEAPAGADGQQEGQDQAAPDAAAPTAAGGGEVPPRRMGRC